MEYPVMPPQNAALQTSAGVDPAVGAESAAIAIETRFGEVAFDHASTIRMPRGLLGYAEYRDFGLTDMPDARLRQFKLLQCLSEPSLSFVVAPLNIEAGLIDEQDIRDAGRILAVDYADAAVLLIVATRRLGDTTQISVNLRAPIIVDRAAHLAWQHVLGNSRYPVRHVVANVAHTPD
jgi:flagellar assembly factor FliW